MLRMFDVSETEDLRVITGIENLAGQVSILRSGKIVMRM